MGGWESVSGLGGGFLCPNGVGFLGFHLYFFSAFFTKKKKESLSICCRVIDP